MAFGEEFVASERIHLNKGSTPREPLMSKFFEGSKLAIRSQVSAAVAAAPTGVAAAASHSLSPLAGFLSHPNPQHRQLGQLREQQQQQQRTTTQTPSTVAAAERVNLAVGTASQWMLLAELELAMVPTSVGDERTFSTMKYMRNPKRNSLK